MTRPDPRLSRRHALARLLGRLGTLGLLLGLGGLALGGLGLARGLTLAAASSLVLILGRRLAARP